MIAIHDIIKQLLKPKANPEENMLYDILIIGAGITGSMLARELSRYELKVAVLDKENDIANGATMANSAIVHTGYDPVDGTLKAELNVKGARKYLGAILA